MPDLLYTLRLTCTVTKWLGNNGYFKGNKFRNICKITAHYLGAVVLYLSRIKVELRLEIGGNRQVNLAMEKSDN